MASVSGTASVSGMPSVGEGKTVTEVDSIRFGHRVAVLNVTESR